MQVRSTTQREFRVRHSGAWCRRSSSRCRDTTECRMRIRAEIPATVWLARAAFARLLVWFRERGFEAEPAKAVRGRSRKANKVPVREKLRFAVQSTIQPDARRSNESFARRKHNKLQSFLRFQWAHLFSTASIG